MPYDVRFTLDAMSLLQAERLDGTQVERDIDHFLQHVPPPSQRCSFRVKHHGMELIVEGEEQALDKFTVFGVWPSPISGLLPHLAPLGVLDTQGLAEHVWQVNLSVTQAANARTSVVWRGVDLDLQFMRYDLPLPFTGPDHRWECTSAVVSPRTGGIVNRLAAPQRAIDILMQKEKVYGTEPLPKPTCPECKGDPRGVLLFTSWVPCTICQS